MQAEWTINEVDPAVDAARALPGADHNLSGPTRLGFALPLLYVVKEARFTASPTDLPPATVEYVARRVGVAAAALDSSDCLGRTIEHHRGEQDVVLRSIELDRAGGVSHANGAGQDMPPSRR